MGPVSGLVTRLVTRYPSTAAIWPVFRRSLPGTTGHCGPARERRTYLSVMDSTPGLSPVFLTQREVAELLRLPVRTVEDWRLTRSGPPYLKLGRHVRYDRDELLAWIGERRHG